MASRPQFGWHRTGQADTALRELHLFMLDPDARQHDFRYTKEVRSELEHIIRHQQLDLDFTTIRKGSPHILSCTKNDNSYHRALARRAADEKLLKQLNAS